MSSKKIYTTIGIDEEVIKRLDSEVDTMVQRTRSFLLEQILRERYGMPWSAAMREVKNANKA